MDIGFDVGVNVPTVVFLGHLVIAGTFFAFAAFGVASGTALPGVFLRALIGALVLGLGVATARII